MNLNSFLNIGFFRKPCSCLKCSVNKICTYNNSDNINQNEIDYNYDYLKQYQEFILEDKVYTKIIDNITYLYQSIVVLIVEKWHQINMDKSVNNLMSVIRGCCFN